ncbi:unnamed protein product [Phytophthora lilii]|uniref:Unnamed protein product n=1 Tax=Phytophthora lilii TaxID=2077276 RepID=A0A9W6T9J1_9STRA|nr:unnamed protein product [Phytophthora lilii]
MSAHAAGKGDQMFISAEAAERVLQPLGDTPINLISIFGAARQGKSFLMNLLADQQDLFKISNLREPCTQGVDLSGHFVPLSRFSGFNGCPPVTPKASKGIHVGFVDAEGQGDRDITYDSRLVSPVLLSSKVVIFNWKDSLQADRMLNLLAVLARAAQGIELADGANTKVFGHLHFFVDSTPEEVYRDLFQKEKGRSEEVNVRNLARVNLVEAFESINIWLFPAPVANTANLRDKIRFDQLQKPFQEKLRELRKCLSNQLQHPMKFYQRPLTAKYLSQIMPALVDTLNSDQVIMPESIYSSMVRAEAQAAKESCEKDISAYCEAAGLEEMVSSDEFNTMLHKDVEIIIQEAYEKMGSFPATVRKEIQTSLRAFAEKEITIALHANSEKIAAHLSKKVDAAFQTLKTECLLIEQTKLPMKGALLREECTKLLNRELARIKALPTGLQGKRGVEIECGRVRQNASLLFDKLEVANDKAIHQSTAALNDLVRAAKARMSSELHDNLDRVFAEKQPVTLTKLQKEVEVLFTRVMKEVTQNAGGVNEFGVSDFRADLEHHKAQLADEMNRRYMIEMRQILGEVSLAAREDITKQVMYRLDGKLPMLEEEIKAAVDSAVAHVKGAMADKLQGWTILKSDLEAKSMELEKLGDKQADKYLHLNQQLEKDAGVRKETEQYEILRIDVTKAFEQKLKEVGFPTSDDNIDSVFHTVLQELAAKFLSSIADCTTTSFTAKGLREILTSDCKPAVENQKMLNRLAIEKKEALELAKKERQMRERERLAAEQREAEINRLKSDHSKWLGEKDNESKQLRDKLQEEERKARELQQRVEEMKLETARLERQKHEEQLKSLEQSRQAEKAKEEEAARLKEELEEMKRKAEAVVEAQNRQQAEQATSEAKKKSEAEELKRQLEQMKHAIAQKEQERVRMELQVRQEQASREQAEMAAQQAAHAAEVAARAAVEAARHQPAPVPVTTEEIGRKRPLVGNGSDDVEMEDVDHSRTRTARAAGEGIASFESQSSNILLIVLVCGLVVCSSQAIAGSQEASRTQQGESSSRQGRQAEDVAGGGSQGRPGRGREAYPRTCEVTRRDKEEEIKGIAANLGHPTLNTISFSRAQRLECLWISSCVRQAWRPFILKHTREGSSAVRDEMWKLKRELHEAKSEIAQLKHQLACMKQLLQQERAAREEAEIAAEHAAKAAGVAARAATEASRCQLPSEGNAQMEQERVNMELMLQRERTAREEAEIAAQQATEAAEVAARAAIAASRHHIPPTPMGIESTRRSDRSERSASEDFEMKDVSDSHPHSPSRAATAQPPSVSRKARKPTKAPASTTKPGGASKTKSGNKTGGSRNSLAEARKLAQEATEKRILAVVLFAPFEIVGWTSFASSPPRSQAPAGIMAETQDEHLMAIVSRLQQINQQERMLYQKELLEARQTIRELCAHIEDLRVRKNSERAQVEHITTTNNNTLIGRRHQSAPLRATGIRHPTALQRSEHDDHGEENSTLPQRTSMSYAGHTCKSTLSFLSYSNTDASVFFVTRPNVVLKTFNIPITFVPFTASRT